MYFNHLIIRISGLKQHLPWKCIQKSSLLEQLTENSPLNIHFETWACICPESEKLSENGTCLLYI